MGKYMFIEAPVCVGSPTHGSEDAYKVLKQKGLEKLFHDNAEFLDFIESREPTNKAEAAKIDKAGETKGIKDLSTVMYINRAHYERMYDALKNGYTPVAVGGDHSIAMSSIAALSDMYGADNVAVIYIDGHTDINTEVSSESGYVHGMPLAEAMGLCCNDLDIGKNKISLHGENTCIIGARSIDDGEYPIIEKQGVHLYTADIVRNRVAAEVVKDVVELVRGKKIHLSFDVDYIDGAEFPATGYVMPNGLSYDSAYGLIYSLLDELSIASFDVVEYNPHMDLGNECLNKLLRIFKLLLNNR